jgi:hypothetical protein
MSDAAEPRRSPGPSMALVAAARDFWSSFLGEPRERNWSPADLLYPHAPFPILEHLPSVADGPRLAAMAWRLALAESHYVQQLGMGWAAGWNEFLADYVQTGPSASLSESIRQWQETMERSMQRTLRSRHYLAAQAELIRRFAAILLERQRLSESVAELFGMATERNLDEAYRRIHELKREVRALQRAERLNEAIPAAADIPVAGTV